MLLRLFAAWSALFALLLLPSCGAGPPALAELRMTRLSGEIVNPLTGPDSCPQLFLFVRDDCPISNRYAPRVRELSDAYEGQGVKFWLVYVDPDTSTEAVRRHQDEFDYPGEPLLDPHHDLVERTGATITPEAALFDAGRRMVYRGRIDNRYVAFGKTRAAATRHDLQDALEAVLAGRPVAQAATRAVGCFITDLEPADPVETR